MIIVIKNQADGFIRTKDIRTYRSSLGMLKYLHNKALKIDPAARILTIDDEPTLVIHRVGGVPGLLTVRIIEK